MVHQFSLLLRSEYAELPVRICFFLDSGLSISANFLLRPLRQVIVISQFGEVLLFANIPRQTVVVRNEDHVVGIDTSEGGKTITHYGEEGDEHAINDVFYVVLSLAEGDPADKEEDPN